MAEPDIPVGVEVRDQPATPTVLMNPVAPVPYWSYWVVPLATLMIGLMQALGVAWIGSKVEGTTKQVIKMEKQINSNMERQITQAISEAIARERLRVNQGHPEAPEKRATEKVLNKSAARDIVDALKCVDNKSPVTGVAC